MSCVTVSHSLRAAAILNTLCFTLNANQFLYYCKFQLAYNCLCINFIIIIINTHAQFLVYIFPNTQ